MPKSSQIVGQTAGLHAQNVEGAESHSQSNPDRRILLFDPGLGGHRGAFLQHLIRYWGEQSLSGHIDIVVNPRFLQQHQDIVELAQTCTGDRVTFVPITEQEEAELGPWTNLIQRKLRSLREWSLLSRYANSLGATECLLMYFDNFQLSAVLRRQLPCPFSAIYFRARFHYGEFHRSLSWWEQTRYWQERRHIANVLHHPQLKTLFCLDEFAVKHLDKLRDSEKVTYLPDPVQFYPYRESEAEQLKSRLGIEPDRQVFLLFGVIDARKGIHQLLEAIEYLPPNLCQKICLLLVGMTKSEDKPRVQVQVAKLSKLLPIQIITCDQYVLDHEIQLYFHLADVVLTPHQRHVGTSNNLIRAAAALKPVLSSGYGQMGAWVRAYRLGLTVDSTIPGAIAEGLIQCLIEPAEQLCDRTQMKTFAEQHSAENYAKVIFQHL